MENNNFVSSVNVVFYDEICLQLFSDNPGQKCWEGSVTFEIAPFPPSPPPPLINVGFCTKQNGDFSDFSSNTEYGGGGPQEHALSQIVQPIVRIIEVGVK